MAEDDEPRYKLYPKGEKEPRKEGSLHFDKEGRAEYVNGDVYEGIYVGSQRGGKGIYTFANGDVYQGQFQINEKDGFGRFGYSDKPPKTGEDDNAADDEENAVKRGGSYLGFYHKGKRGCGPDADPDETDDGICKSAGTFAYVNKDVYVGQWRDGKKHGQGAYRYAKDDTQLQGTWVDGQIQQGRWIFPNGTFYCGKFAFNKPTGKGVWVFKNGTQLTGSYEQKCEKDEEQDDENAEKPKPKLQSVSWKSGKYTSVRGGDAFGPKCGAIPLVKPELDWPPPYKYE